MDQIVEGVWQLGQPHPQSNGGRSYYVKAKAGGVVVDVPMLDDGLLEELKKQGGAKWLLLTRKDSTGAAARTAAKLDAVVVHPSSSRPDPMPAKARAFDADFMLAEGLRVFSTPGRTPGDACLLFEAGDGVLFSGEHLMLSKGHVQPVHFPNTWDWDLQIENTVKLLAFEFAAVLPANGNFRRRLTGAKSDLERCLSELEADPL